MLLGQIIIDTDSPVNRCKGILVTAWAQKHNVETLTHRLKQAAYVPFLPVVMSFSQP